MSLPPGKEEEELLTELVKLEAVVESEWKRDLRGAPSWFGPEGERVYELTKGLVTSAKDGSLQRALGGISIFEYLGIGWLESHSDAHTQTELVNELLTRRRAGRFTSP